MSKNKVVKFGTEARNKLKAGVDILADSVKSTLGPRGRHACIEQDYGIPLITKDGVTVAKSINLKDPIEDMGAQLVKYVASNTNFNAGDGTTTATVLSQAIFNHGIKLVEAGNNPVLVKRGMDVATELVVKNLEDMSIKITDKNQIANIATISANNDSNLGNMIADIIDRIGDDGIISVEESTGNTSVEYVDGMRIDRGFVDPYFVEDTAKNRTVYQNPLIAVIDDDLTHYQDVLAPLQKAAETKRPLVIIAKSITETALQTIALNHSRGVQRTALVRAPGFGDIRRDMMSDVALVTGGKLFTEDEGSRFADAEIEDFGSCNKITVHQNHTEIIEGSGDKQKVLEFSKNLKEQLEYDGLFDYQIASLRQRISSLSGSVAVLKVGGITESEMRERKDRIEDSINSVKAAIDEGIVSGGGSALLHCVNSLKEYDYSSLTPEEIVGFSIIEKSIQEPFRQILKNAGSEGFEFMSKIINDENTKSGFNALTMKFSEDMINDGIIDPVKVTKTALENASSAIGTFLTTEVVICNDLEEDQKS